MTVTFELGESEARTLSALALAAGISEGEYLNSWLRARALIPVLPVEFGEVPADFDWSRSTGLIELAESREAARS